MRFSIDIPIRQATIIGMTLKPASIRYQLQSIRNGTSLLEMTMSKSFKVEELLKVGFVLFAVEVFRHSLRFALAKAIT